LAVDGLAKVEDMKALRTAVHLTLALLKVVRRMEALLTRLGHLRMGPIPWRSSSGWIKTAAASLARRNSQKACGNFRSG
jgi:hypothetical protein